MIPAPLTAYWTSLSRRDRRVAASGLGIVTLLLGWAFVWHPIQLRHAQAVERVAHDRQSLAYVRGAAAALKGERPASATAGAERAGRSLLALADATARKDGLEGALKRVEPVSGRNVRVTFELASFDTLVLWIEGLASDYAIRVTDFSADRADGIGLVNARVTLEDAP